MEHCAVHDQEVEATSGLAFLERGALPPLRVRVLNHRRGCLPNCRIGMVRCNMRPEVEATRVVPLIVMGAPMDPLHPSDDTGGHLDVSHSQLLPTRSWFLHRSWWPETW